MRIESDLAGTDQFDCDFDLDADRLREECGVFGIYGHPEAAAITALGLHALQHRGQEAAGITKFKTKKRLAEAKLESAKQNLSRVYDILEEVTRQVNSLKRQAGKARRYNELKAELESIGYVVRQVQRESRAMRETRKRAAQG